jgi:hypothetical protein
MSYSLNAKVMQSVTNAKKSSKKDKNYMAVSSRQVEASPNSSITHAMRTHYID